MGMFASTLAFHPIIQSQVIRDELLQRVNIVQISCLFLKQLEVDELFLFHYTSISISPVYIVYKEQKYCQSLAQSLAQVSRCFPQNQFAVFPGKQSHHC